MRIGLGLVLVAVLAGMGCAKHDGLVFVSADASNLVMLDTRGIDRHSVSQYIAFPSPRRIEQGAAAWYHVEQEVDCAKHLIKTPTMEAFDENSKLLVSIPGEDWHSTKPASIEGKVLELSCDAKKAAAKRMGSSDIVELRKSYLKLLGKPTV